jgi:DNA-binding MarR family transcriptional regulator
MTSNQEQVAHQLVNLIPQLMRHIGINMRCHRAGLAPAHYRILGMLTHGGGSVSVLAGQHAVTLATMSNSVAALADRGLVERVPSMQDRRSVQVRITTAGEQVLADMHAHFQQHISIALQDLTSEELVKVSTGLEILERVIVVADKVATDTLCQKTDELT